MTHVQVDLAIAGGGLVGASLACALAPLGYSIAVIEAVQASAEFQPSYDDRTLALNRASCQILAGIGLWQGLAPRATAIRQVIVSEVGRPGRVVLEAGEMDLDSFGHIVEARTFGQAVLEKARGLESVQWYCPAQVTGLEQGPESIRLKVAGADDSGLEIEAALVVGADGTQSTIRELLGIEASGRDYGQNAVICNVMPGDPHEGRALERMTDTGPFALLPHVEGRCGLVWCVAREQAQELMDMPDETFLQLATERSGGEFGPLTRLGKRSSYPLHQTLSGREIAPRAVILGNAAHAIHPVGAQGFNLGLRDVAVLAELLHAATESGADPGALELLEAYAAWREPDKRATAAQADGLVGLFSSHSPVAMGLRTAGLLAHAALPGLRRRMATQAMGFRGRVPRLAMGETLGHGA